MADDISYNSSTQYVVVCSRKRDLPQQFYIKSFLQQHIVRSSEWSLSGYPEYNMEHTITA